MDFRLSAYSGSCAEPSRDFPPLSHRHRVATRGVAPVRSAAPMDEWVNDQLDQWVNAKRIKDFATADRIRDELRA